MPPYVPVPPRPGFASMTTVRAPLPRRRDRRHAAARPAADHEHVRLARHGQRERAGLGRVDDGVQVDLDGAAFTHGLDGIVGRHSLEPPGHRSRHARRARAVQLVGTGARRGPREGRLLGVEMGDERLRPTARLGLDARQAPGVTVRRGQPHPVLQQHVALAPVTAVYADAVPHKAECGRHRQLAPLDGADALELDRPRIGLLPPPSANSTPASRQTRAAAVASTTARQAMTWRPDLLAITRPRRQTATGREV